ncbi:unnamed protein product [Adineta ricciae]|nr:unnamed protein product [Adineta ricciae]
MTIDKDFLSNLTHTDDQDEYKRNDTIQIGFEQELKSLTVLHGESARFEAKIRLISISTCKPIDLTLLKVEWRLNDISIGMKNTFKYQFGCSIEDNRYWMDIQHCQRRDEKVYTIYISYDDERLHDESSAYLFVDNCPDENEELLTPTIETSLVPIGASSSASVKALDRFVPPTITRLLQPSYQYHPGEQLHFLVEYISPTSECQSTWQVQHSYDQQAKPVEDGLIVNADCSSILIIESITSRLQGLYTFFVENLYGRAMTQTIVTVDSDESDNHNAHYNVIQDDMSNKSREIAVYHSNGASSKHLPAVHNSSSSESSEYEELKIHSFNDKSSSSMSTATPTDEDMIVSIGDVQPSLEQKLYESFDLSIGKDLYGQRHIAYFDPSSKFEHVEPIEQFENDDSLTRLAMNDQRMKNDHTKSITKKFRLPPPPPIEHNSEEHIYEDIPQILPIPEMSASTSVQQQQQSIEISDHNGNGVEQTSVISSSPNSLDEALNNVEQWSDIIMDNDILELRSSSRFSQTSNYLSNTNDYVDEHYLNYSFHSPSMSHHMFANNNQSISSDCLQQHIEFVVQPNLIADEQTITTERIEQVLPTDASHCIEQAVETIHVEDGLFQVKETVVDQKSFEMNDMATIPTEAPMTTIHLPEAIASDVDDDTPLDSIMSQVEESVEVLSHQVLDQIVSSIESTPFINCTFENTPIAHFSVSNVSTSSTDPVIATDATTNEQMPIITLTIIGDKMPEYSQESLTVPMEPNLLPLATVPDQTKDTDDVHAREKIVQDIISASLEPTTVIHIEGTVEIIPSTSTLQTNELSVLNDTKHFFVAESDAPNTIIKTDVTSITVLGKPSITLAEAEKLQHNAVNEQVQNDTHEIEVTLPPTNGPSTASTEVESVLSSSSLSIQNDDVPVEKSTNVKQETTILTQQQESMDKKPKFVTQKATNTSCTLAEKSISAKRAIFNGHTDTLTSQKISSEPRVADMQKVSAKKKQEPVIIEKVLSIDSNVSSTPESKSLTNGNHDEVKPTPVVPIEQKSVPPKFTQRLKPSITINHDDQLQLNVSYIGQPEPHITWYYKSTILLPSSQINISQSHNDQMFCCTLTIQKMTSDYDGKFKAVLNNDLGEVISTTQVNVKRGV